MHWMASSLYYVRYSLNKHSLLSVVIVASKVCGGAIEVIHVHVANSVINATLCPHTDENFSTIP